MIVHAYHGWASDASIWNQVASELGPEVTLRRYDRGYFGSVNHLIRDEKPDVIVTHSMGLMFVPPQILANVRLLIVLNGFSFFPSTDVLSRRKSLSILSMMKSNVFVDAEAQLEVFCSTAGLDLNNIDHKKMNVNLLSADLDILATTSIAPNHLGDSTIIHFLHSTRDPIVSDATIRDTVNAFPTAIHHKIESKTHNLPCSDGDLVRKLIFNK